MSFASTPSFLTAAITAVIEVAAVAWAAATVGFWTVTPIDMSATSGATLTSPTPETVTVCSGVVEVEASAASAEWLPRIGPTITPMKRPAAAVSAITRPRVMGPARRSIGPGVVFADISLIVVLPLPLG